MWESVAANAFLDALNDPVLALEVRKRNVTTLDSAYREAALLEGFIKASTKQETSRREQVRVIGSSSALSAGQNKNSVPSMVQEMQSRQTVFEQQFAQTQQAINQMQATLQQIMCQNENGRMQANPSAGPQNSVTGRNRPPRGRCYNCNESGHYAHACPNQPASFATTNTLASDQTNQSGPHNRAISRRLQSARTAYLSVTICGKPRWALLDTGCEVTVFAARHLHDVGTQPTTQKLTAANGSDIEVLGEATVAMVIGNTVIPTRCLVSEYVDELILGLDWLETHKCVWDFGKRSIVIDGQSYKLFAHQPTWRVRRIVLHESVVVPARSECTIEADTVYADLTARSCHWASAPMPLKPGVYIARSLVADQPRGVQVRVVNVTNDGAVLEKGTSLGYLEEVAVVSNDASDDDEQLPDIDHLTAVFETIDESVAETDRNELWQLLVNYSAVFSKGENDLGVATAVQHTIDTETNRPVRQPLRRQPIHLAAAADEQIQSMIDQGIVRPSRSDWSSNLVLVKKKRRHSSLLHRLQATE